MKKLLIIILLSILSVNSFTQNVICSFYHKMFHGRKTANGEIFSQYKYTAASNFYPFNTILRVTNIKNGKSVIVRINDLMHPRYKKNIDLALVAAHKIGLYDGITKVKITKI